MMEMLAHMTARFDKQEAMPERLLSGLNGGNYTTNVLAAATTAATTASSPLEGGDEPAMGGIGLNSTEFERMKKEPGAIFDYLYGKCVAHENMYDAFKTGFLGCPPISEMESSAYADTWRVGEKRCRRMHEIKIVYNDIEAQHLEGEDLLQYMRNMSVKYTKSSGRAVSTISRKIQKVNSMSQATSQ